MPLYYTIKSYIKNWHFTHCNCSKLVRVCSCHLPKQIKRSCVRTNFMTFFNFFHRFQHPSPITCWLYLLEISPLSSFHKCFPGVHLWPFQSLSLCKFLDLQPIHYGLQDHNEQSKGDQIVVTLVYTMKTVVPWSWFKNSLALLKLYFFNVSILS